METRKRHEMGEATGRETPSPRAGKSPTLAEHQGLNEVGSRRLCELRGSKNLVNRKPDSGAKTMHRCRESMIRHPIDEEPRLCIEPPARTRKVDTVGGRWCPPQKAPNSQPKRLRRRSTRGNRDHSPTAPGSDLHPLANPFAADSDCRSFRAGAPVSGEMSHEDDGGIRSRNGLRLCQPPADQSDSKTGSPTSDW
jgi:hypothetical protein